MQVEHIRDVSAAFFGNKHRLELIAALVNAADPGVSAGDLARELGVAASVLTPQMQAWERRGLVRRWGPGPGADRRVYYSIEPSTLWTALARVVDDLGVGAEADGMRVDA